MQILKPPDNCVSMHDPYNRLRSSDTIIMRGNWVKHEPYCPRCQFQMNSGTCINCGWVSICAWCKKVKLPGDHYRECFPKEYHHSGTSGLCPECKKKIIQDKGQGA